MQNYQPLNQPLSDTGCPLYKRHCPISLAWKTLLLSAILLGLARRGYCQANIITIDTLTVSPSKPYPFDTTFVVKFTPPKNKKVTSVDIFRVTSRGCMRNIFPRCFGCFLRDAFKPGIPVKAKNKLKLYLSSVFIGSTIRPYKIPMDNMRYDSTGNLFIRFPQLQPNRNYVVAISTIPVFEQIDSVLIALHNKNTNAAQIRLAQLSSATQKTLRLGDPARCNQCEPIPFQIDGNIADFLNFYDSVNIDKYLTIIDTNTVLLSRQRNAHIRMRDVDSAHLYNINESLISTFIAYAMECLTCKDTVWQFNWFTKNNINIPLLLTNLDKLKDSLVSKGYTTVDSLYFYMAIDTSIQKRAGNLLYSFNSISNLRQLVDYFIYKYHLNPSAVTSFRQSLARAGEVFLYNYTALITQYKTFSKLLSDSADARKSITMAIANYKGFTQPFTSLNSNTYSFDFETRSGFVLKADFGFLYYGNLTKRSPLEGLSPYIGFHVNFRPLNTNVKFYKINHKGVQGHLSFVSGVLLASLKETGKRDGLIGDASVFTGLGWAFSHAVRLTAGAVFYRKSDSNPLIDHKTTAATAFAGMSFDLRLKEAYTSLKKIFEP